MELFVKSRSDAELKQIVRDYLAGAIFFSAQVPTHDQHLMACIFMPLALGALSYNVPPPVTPEVPVFSRERPPLPDAENAEDAAAEELQAELRGLRERLAQAEQAQREGDLWAEYDSDQALADIEALKEEINAFARAAQERERARLRARRQAHVPVLQAYRRARKEHQQALVAWAQTVEEMRPQLEEWERGRDQYFEKLKEELGVLYAYMSDASPRTINGYPTFFSMGVLNVADWKRVREAINREQARGIEV